MNDTNIKRGPGRPRLFAKCTTVKITLDESDYQCLQRLANNADCSVSALVRRWIQSPQTPHTSPVPPHSSTHLGEAGVPSVG